MKEERFQHLVESYLEGTIAEGDARELADALDASAPLRERMREEVCMAVLLRKHSEGVPEHMVAQVQAGLRTDGEKSDFVAKVRMSLPASATRAKRPDRARPLRVKTARLAVADRRYRGTAPRGWGVTAAAAAVLIGLAVLISRQWRQLRIRPPGPVIRIEHVQGAASLLTRSGQSAASEGCDVLPGETILTGTDGSTVAAYAGHGIQLVIGPRTRLTVGTTSLDGNPADRPQQLLLLAAGAATVNVTKRLPRQSVFATPHAEVRVVGTRFTLNVLPQTTVVGVEAGRVQVLNMATRETLSLQAGYRAEIGVRTTVRASPGPAPPAHRDAALVALYTFEEGRGRIVHDVSGVGMPLNLTVEDPDAVQWIPGGGLIVRRPTIMASDEPGTKIAAACMASGELTLEAWVRPADLTAVGPARIMALSRDTGHANFMLGQWQDYLHGRVRTTETIPSACPALATHRGSVTVSALHIVHTRDRAGRVRCLINGRDVSLGLTDTRPTQDSPIREGVFVIGGDLSVWERDMRLTLADEFTRDRTWLGEYYLVAVYARALSEQETRALFERRTQTLRTAADGS
ncbi:MAG: FecR domain-containing protein [Kiritimatiellae bacterium]|nr:FecR domain-containing protein [Kiritimatiellia bacterium]